jgi:hypothetical protein
LTASNGYITTQTLLEYNESGISGYKAEGNTSGRTYFTNYTVNATKSGYTTSSKQINLTSSQSIYLTLVTSEYLLTVSLSSAAFWWNDPVNISIQATRGGTPVVGGNVTILKNSIAVCSQSSATDSNGRYSCIFNAANNLGSYPIQVNVTDPLGDITNTSSLIVKITLGSTELEKIRAPQVSCYDIPRIIVNPDGSLQKTKTKVCVWR